MVSTRNGPGRWSTDEAGREGSMIQLIILLAMLVRYEQNKYVPPASEYVSPHEELTEKVTVTWYINPNGNHTASGGNTFKGSCASSRDHIGDVAALYSKEGYFIGYFDCNDTGGTEAIKTGKVIDIYADSIEEIYRAAEEWGTEYQVLWIEADG